MPGFHRARVRWFPLLALTLALLPTVAAADQDRQRVLLPGLEQPVEILVDRWGVAHIYAENEHDLFFAQGYEAARSRLFQLEVWRRRATGTVAEILGPRELDRDIGARLLRFRGDMQRELNHYHPRGEAIIGAFVAGINARVEETLRDRDLLPIEFRVLGIEPGLWTPETVVSRHQGLVYNASEELDLARALLRMGPEKTREAFWLHPGEPVLELDEAIDGELLFDDVLRLYRAARAPLEFLPEDVLPEYRAPADEEADGTHAAALPLYRPAEGWHEVGSNNWVVDRRRTESGSTMMANDPHRVLGAPSLRYFVHLVAPGWNVIGGGEPALPGVSIGHNGHGAWGLTIFHIDNEDLYVYETHPDDPSQYRYLDGWEPMRIVRETIPVRGEPPVEVELKFTRHGPVLHEDHGRRAAVALRAGWLETGGAPYLASLRMNVARDWEEFREACRYSHIPGENMVWADREGNIGWQVVGIAPLRPNWQGLLPVPGDGRYEWQGYLPGRSLPHAFNPPEGFLNTSNENVVPHGYEHRGAAGWTWADPFRGARVREVLASGRRLNMMDMMRLQQDELSIPARTLVPLLAGLEPDDDALRDALDRLGDWDFVLDRRSVPAGIWNMFERRLEANLLERTVPEEAREHVRWFSMKRMIDRLLAPDGRFGPDPIAGRDALLQQSLREAVEELTERFGPDPRDWRYGQADYKHALMRHPLSAAVRGELRATLDVGPLPRGGNRFTVNNTGGSDNQPHGGTFRVIVDTGDWDAAVATNSPGQSGDPESPHYRDLAEMWARGGYFPLLYSRPAVESVRSHTRTLVPDDGP